MSPDLRAVVTRAENSSPRVRPPSTKTSIDSLRNFNGVSNTTRTTGIGELDGQSAGSSGASARRR